jgi:hypothetical protein
MCSNHHYSKIDPPVSFFSDVGEVQGTSAVDNIRATASTGQQRVLSGYRVLIHIPKVRRAHIVYSLAIPTPIKDWQG